MKLSTAKPPVYNDAAEVTTLEPTNKEPKSGMYVRRVVTDFVPLNKEGGSKSFGLILDEMIEDALKNNGQIQSAELMITDSDWQDLRYKFGQH